MPMSSLRKATTGTDGTHTALPWNGEPRVIYHDVLARVELLKQTRKLTPKGTTVGMAATGNANDAQQLQKRFVDVIFDPPGETYDYYHGKVDTPEPEVTVIDFRGRERRAVYVDDDMEPVPVGSVLLVREPQSAGRAEGGAGLAAYLVGEEEYQTLVVGNGIACSPTLLTQDLYNATGGIGVGERNRLPRSQRKSARRAHVPGGEPNDDYSYEDNEDILSTYNDHEDHWYSREEKGGAQPGGVSGKPGSSFGGIGGEPGVEGGRGVEERRKARALGLRQKAVETFFGRGEGGGGGAGRSTHELFRKAADMGDPSSFFYLSLLQSAGLHGGQAGAGQAQARTWAVCGVNAFDVDAVLLVAFRFHGGHGEKMLCRDGFHFYRQAIDYLRLYLTPKFLQRYAPDSTLVLKGSCHYDKAESLLLLDPAPEDRADEIQAGLDAPDVFRLGGAHGLGGWGVNVGAGGRGFGGGGPAAPVSVRGIGGGWAAGGMDAMTYDMDPMDDLFLRAETGDPTAMMAVGYLYMTGSEEFALEKNYARAEQLMWQAVRAGESRAFGYLGWMHHHGKIGDHAPPHLQPQLKPHEDWSGPMSEELVRVYAAMRFGDWVLAKDRSEKTAKEEGVGMKEGEGEGELQPGQDIWGGFEDANAVFDWVLRGGGVTGANEAAEMYRRGFEAGDPGCATFLGDMYLHSEYSDSRDGKGAGGRWSMLMAEKLYSDAREQGKEYRDPQPIAALRLGTMLQHGLVPFKGVNMTEAFSYYTEAETEGSMDALLTLADLNYYGYEGVVSASCADGAKMYKRYADLCIMEEALADGRMAFEQGRYSEAFLEYLIAAEQGSKEGQASLAWLINQGLPSRSKNSGVGIMRRMLNIWNPLEQQHQQQQKQADGNSASGDSSSKRAGKVGGDGAGGDSGNWGDALSKVVAAVREMGGDPEAMAKGYRLLAAEQGDADSRCEIADELYEQAKAQGAVQVSAGYFPLGIGDNKKGGRRQGLAKSLRMLFYGAHDVEAGSVVEDGGSVERAGAAGTKHTRITHKGSSKDKREGEDVLQEAVKFYRLAAESADSGGSRRALFSMGWLHQHGVGVSMDPDLARQYYSKSRSAPGALGLLIMGVSDFFNEAVGPLLLSAAAVGIAMWWMKSRRIGAGGIGGQRGQHRAAGALRAGGGAGGLGGGRGASNRAVVGRARAAAVQGQQAQAQGSETATGAGAQNDASSDNNSAAAPGDDSVVGEVVAAGSSSRDMVGVLGEGEPAAVAEAADTDAVAVDWRGRNPSESEPTTNSIEGEGHDRREG